MSIYNDSRKYSDGDEYDQWKAEAEWEARFESRHNPEKEGNNAGKLYRNRIKALQIRVPRLF